MDTLTPFSQLAILVLRLWTGLNFVLVHGWWKLRDPGGFIANPALLDFPGPSWLWGWAVILAEFVGGILLTIGVGARFGAAGILGTMLGGAFVVHAADPWERKEFALVYAAIAFFFVAHGPGEFSLDQLWKGRRA